MASFPADWEQLETSLRVDVQAAIATLLATVEALNAITAMTNATINANPAAIIKDVVREVKTCARQAIRLARLQVAAFDTGDIGV
jgi:phage-related tail protein